MDKHHIQTILWGVESDVNATSENKNQTMQVKNTLFGQNL